MSNQPYFYDLKTPFWFNLKEEQLYQLPAVYSYVWNHVKVENPALSLCDTNKLYQILLSSCVKREVLASIWFQVNKSIPGHLTLQEMVHALALIAIIQMNPFSGVTINDLRNYQSPPSPFLSAFSEQIKPDLATNQDINNIETNNQNLNSVEDEFSDFQSAPTISISEINAKPTQVTRDSNEDDLLNVQNDNLLQSKEEDINYDRYSVFRTLSAKLDEEENEDFGEFKAHSEDSESFEHSKTNSYSEDEYFIGNKILSCCNDIISKVTKMLTINYDREIAIEALKTDEGKQFALGRLTLK